MTIDGETRDKLADMDMLATTQHLLKLLEAAGDDIKEWALSPWPVKYATTKEGEWPIEIKTVHLIIKVVRT